jgi:hypothetical protein
MANYIATAKAPNLPIVPNQFSQDYGNLLTNALRLYFNQLDSANGSTIREDNKLNALVWLNAGTGLF